jgi:RNA-directed DNA polymerase
MTSKTAKAKGAERKQRMDTRSLMEQIVSKENLNAAYLQVVRNKGAAGVDGMNVEELGAYLWENGENIREQLKTRKYKPQPVRRVEIPKPDGGTRKLGVPTVVDRFVQQAVLKALEMMNDGHNWIVDIDLAKFFDTVDHDKMMTDDEYEDTIVGTPQGGNISPLLANIMLNELDKELEARGLDFVRYADDLIIMVGSKKAAERVMKSVSRYIEEKLGLKVNAEKSKVDKPQGIKYLGFGFYYDRYAKGYKARPHPKAVAKFKAQMKKLTCRSWGVSNSYKVQRLNQLIRGWINYFKIGSMKVLCERLDSSIRYRLRMCIWKHWKTAKNRAKNLMKLGVPRWAAYNVAYCGDRYARLAHNGWVHKAISNERLAAFGLVSMSNYYAERRVKC